MFRSLFRDKPFQKKSVKAARRSQQLRFENLERREMLSVTPPTVTDVSVSSTEWSTEFFDYLELNSLGNDGYSIPTGSTDQTKSLPWENIDQIKITFNEDVYVDAADFSLSGVNTVNYTVADFHYDAFHHVATWTLENYLTPDRLMIDLDADGIDPITNLAGTILDGEWSNNVSSGPSGDGTAGGDFEFEFSVLPGDPDQNTIVTYADYSFVRAREGQDTSGPNYTALHDIDGSGLIDATDWQHLLQNHLWKTVPTGQPAGATNDAPTTTGVGLVDLEVAAVDAVISLFDAFEDAENSDSQLQFSIVNISNSSLLDTASINASTGELTLSGAAGASGRAKVTVQATDSQGLSTRIVIPADVAYENQPPVITNFFSSQHPGDTWMLSGYVSDPDDDLDGWVVEFFGVLGNFRFTTNEDGYFQFAVILEEGQEGFEHAITHDPHGEVSNAPVVWVGFT